MSTPFEAARNEVRVRWDCQEVSERLRIDAAGAYDENGTLTGWIAVDPIALQDAIDAYIHCHCEEGEA
ncbi:hypothetical protein [Kribbella jiaozuonensis]|uniref:Uncharacterized protein n=1 Tax=Kribbella jiaozuonensis TaxID=2575441 RepID=A0A4V5UX27_9ACTN|nr:hypothetical protein [Kribbella jiaozuonensis]TKK79163.1 hypothetical protein FDA38_12080 [Kribbella jiaozuonensis]TKK83233.1 hypothetical protein FDA38_11035 [Kribbella jiaozuonensis]